MNAKRASNIELLRLVLMLMVVMLHFYGYGIGMKTGDNSLMARLGICSFLIVAVNTFVFISGYFGIKFKVKGLISLLIQVFSYSIGLLVFAVLFKLPVSKTIIIKSFLPISTGLWWFVSVFVMLYIISPLLNIGLRSISKRHFQFILLFLFYMTSTYGFILGRFTGYSLIPFITIYLIGRYMNMYNLKIKYPFFFYILFSLMTYAVLAGANIKFSGEAALHWTNRLIDYHNPLIILSAVCLFFTFNSFTIQSDLINKLATYSFGVYLFHINPIIWNLIDANIITFIKANFTGIKLIGVVFITTLTIFIISLGVEYVRQLITRPMEQFLLNRLNVNNLKGKWYLSKLHFLERL